MDVQKLAYAPIGHMRGHKTIRPEHKNCSISVRRRVESWASRHLFLFLMGSALLVSAAALIAVAALTFLAMLPVAWLD